MRRHVMAHKEHNPQAPWIAPARRPCEGPPARRGGNGYWKIWPKCNFDPKSKGLGMQHLVRDLNEAKVRAEEQGVHGELSMAGMCGFLSTLHTRQGVMGADLMRR